MLADRDQPVVGIAQGTGRQPSASAFTQAAIPAGPHRDTTRRQEARADVFVQMLARWAVLAVPTIGGLLTDWSSTDCRGQTMAPAMVRVSLRGRQIRARVTWSSRSRRPHDRRGSAKRGPIAPIAGTGRSCQQRAGERDRLLMLSGGRADWRSFATWRGPVRRRGVTDRQPEYAAVVRR